MFLSKCAVCDGKNLKIVKQHKASGLLSESTSSKMPLEGLLLF